MTPDSPFQLTLPAREADLLRKTFKDVGVILEYGSGGSTLLAADAARMAVFSVESDPAWARRMQAWFVDTPPKVPVHVLYSDVGPTGKWGSPSNKTKTRQWPAYALSIWDHPAFLHPDVVLVDGRFRLACMLTTLFRITRPVLLLCDDYLDRPSYHRFETLAGKPEMTGRMAAFTLTPQSFPVAQMGWIIAAYSDPV